MPPYTKEQKANYDKRRRDRRRRFLSLFKLWAGCADCGYAEHPFALQFDHTENNKTENVGLMMNHRFERIVDEITKCEVVCANCHMIRTYDGDK